jgi:hypothetical protein
MKNFIKRSAIIAFVGIIGFSMSACIINLPDDWVSTDNSPLEGMWQQDINLWIIEIQGRHGYMRDWGNGLKYYEQSAVEKGYIKIGEPHIQNLVKTGDLKWSGEAHIIQGNSVNLPATGIIWMDCTIILAEDGSYFSVYRSSNNTFIATYRKR